MLSLSSYASNPDDTSTETLMLLSNQVAAKFNGVNKYMENIVKYTEMTITVQVQ